MPQLTFEQEMEIENSYEWKVLLTNDPNIMGTRLIDGLIRLLSRKTCISEVSIKRHYQLKSKEGK